MWIYNVCNDSRENLNIKMRSAEEMDQADVELRDTIVKVWPFTAKEKIEILVPTTKDIGKGKLTVGKIYGGLLMLDNWKATKFGNISGGTGGGQGGGGKFGALSDMINVRGRTGSGSNRVCVDGGVQISSGETQILSLFS